MHSHSSIGPKLGQCHYLVIPSRNGIIIILEVEGLYFALQHFITLALQTSNESIG